jgi:hypothetical protein
MMPALIAQAAFYLAPFIPFLMGNAIDAGKEKAKELLGEKKGDPEAAWNKAFRIWEVLKPEVEKKPEVAKELLETAKQAESDSDAKPVVSFKLKKIMEGLSKEQQEKIKDVIDEKDAKASIGDIITAYTAGVAIKEFHGGNITTHYEEGGAPPHSGQ